MAISIDLVALIILVVVVVILSRLGTVLNWVKKSDDKLDLLIDQLEAKGLIEIKAVRLKICPACGHSMGEGTTRCWKKDCLFKLPKGQWVTREERPVESRA